ncbi:hypothetical protein GCM10009077_40220 [Roseibium denhamense]
MLSAEPIPFELPDAGQGTALAFSSQRAVYALNGAARAGHLRQYPVFAVGDATANACREAGYQTVLSANGDLTALARTILQAADDFAVQQVLYFAAQDRAGDLAGLLQVEGIPCQTVETYRMVTVPTLPAEILTNLSGGIYDGVLVYSRRTSEAFASALSQSKGTYGIGKLPVYALSTRAGAPLSDVAHLKISPHPREDALLDLVLGKC